MMNLSVARKTALAFAVICLTVIIAGIVLVSALRGLDQAAQQDAHSNDVIQTMVSLRESMVNRETGIRGYIISANTDSLAPYKDGLAGYTAALARAKELTADNPAQQGRLREVDDAVTKWTDAVADKVIKLMAAPEGRAEAAKIEATGTGKAMFDALRAKIAEAVNVEHGLQAQRNAAMAGTMSLALWGAILAPIITLALCVLVAIGIDRVVTAPINALTEVMRRLADRHLDTAIPSAERGDELGAMARAVQVFRDNMIRADELHARQEAERTEKTRRQEAVTALTKNFADRIGVIAQTVSSAAAQVKGNSESLTHTAEDTARRSTTVAAAAEQATANVQTVASASEELSASISEISRQVAKASNVAERAVDAAETTDGTVRGLAESAHKIGAVVSLINDIASQTNLLALNATIEAARAGEAGKGFAVVASEVKSLANQTARATGDIQLQVQAIQSQTEQAVTAIGAIAQIIREISEITTNVASAVEEQGAATAEIARNVQQAAQGTTEVSSNIISVTEAAKTTGRSAGEMLGASNNLAQQASTLRGEVEGFVGALRAA